MNMPRLRETGWLPDQPYHDGSQRYVATSAVDLGDVVPVWLRVPRGDLLDQAIVRSTPDAEPHYAEAKVERADEHATWYRAEVSVTNPITKYRWLLSGPRGAYRWVNGSGAHGHDVPDAHDFTLTAHRPPPAWAEDCLVYQIFPDRFARSAAAAERELPTWAIPAGWDDPVEHLPPDVAHQFYGGDLDGIVEHLDHIEQLGFNTVYLTPFFPAESNHRYNASSFNRVDPLLGGDEALARLSAAVHARGMRIMGDLTTNHSGSTHEWFLAAEGDPGARERDFYYFRDDGSYIGWYDVPTLPKFRFGTELYDRMLRGPKSVVGQWLIEPYGLDGWRIDVANMTGRQAFDDVNHDVARTIRRTMLDLAPDSLLVAEHCHDASGDLSGDGWHGAMNYSGFLRPVWAWLRSPDYHETFLGVPVPVPRLGAEAAYLTMREFQAVTPWRSLTASWSLLGSHDTPRVLTMAGDRDVVGVAAGLMFTSPGVPMMFAGDELGGRGVNGEDARRPMPWDRPQAWDQTTLRRYRDLAHLRAGSDALRRGGRRFVWAGGDVLAYLRETPQESMLCLAVRGPADPIAIPASQVDMMPGETAVNLYGGAGDLHADASGSISIDADGPTFQVWRIR